MKRTAGLTLLVMLLFVAGTFSLPVHLLVDDHHWSEESEDGDQDHHQDPAHPAHPTADHETIAVSPSRIQYVALDLDIVTPVAVVSESEPDIFFIPEQESDPPPVSRSGPPPSRAPPLS
jgi:hypothetical protein